LLRASCQSDIIKSMKKILGSCFAFLLIAFAGVAFGADAVSISRDLSFGSRGDDVKALQEFLAKDKAIYPEAIVSGYFGKLTQAAVKRFQESRGITPVLGYVGPKTRAKLASETLAPKAPTNDLASLLQQLEELKRRLADEERKKAEASVATTITPPAAEQATTTPVVVEPPPATPVVSNTLTISGGSTKPPAESVKIGDISFTNNSTTSAILFHINVAMDEALNAPNSRGVIFKMSLRNGTSTFDTVLEKKDVTLRLRVADTGAYNSQPLTFYAGQNIAPGETKTLSLWAELLAGPFYSGLLRFTITSATTIPELTSVGTAVLNLIP